MAKSKLTLQAPELLRQQAYINGNWCDADVATGWRRPIQQRGGVCACAEYGGSGN